MSATDAWRGPNPDLRPLESRHLHLKKPRGALSRAALRWRKETGAGAWQKRRTDSRIAGDLDRFFTAASQHLGEESERAALRAASSRRRVKLPGVGPEHQAGMDELARHFVQVREGLPSMPGGNTG